MQGPLAYEHLRADFLAGQYFDIRLEVHAPINGSEATGNSKADEKFTFTISKGKGYTVPATQYFKVPEPKLEHWNFSWYEGRCVITFTRLLANEH
jgi:hypothetical protein